MYLFNLNCISSNSVGSTQLLSLHESMSYTYLLNRNPQSGILFFECCHLLQHFVFQN